MLIPTLVAPVVVTTGVPHAKNSSSKIAIQPVPVQQTAEFIRKWVKNVTEIEIAKIIYWIGTLDNKNVFVTSAKNASL